MKEILVHCFVKSLWENMKWSIFGPLWGDFGIPKHPFGSSGTPIRPHGRPEGGGPYAKVAKV